MESIPIVHRRYVEYGAVTTQPVSTPLSTLRDLGATTLRDLGARRLGHRKDPLVAADRLLVPACGRTHAATQRLVTPTSRPCYRRLGPGTSRGLGSSPTLPCCLLRRSAMARNSDVRSRHVAAAILSIPIALSRRPRQSRAHSGQRFRCTLLLGVGGVRVYQRGGQVRLL